MSFLSDSKFQLNCRTINIKINGSAARKFLDNMETYVTHTSKQLSACIMLAAGFEGYLFLSVFEVY